MTENSQACAATTRAVGAGARSRGAGGGRFRIRCQSLRGAGARCRCSVALSVQAASAGFSRASGRSWEGGSDRRLRAGGRWTPHPLRLLAAAVLLVAATLAGAPGAGAQTGVSATGKPGISGFPRVGDELTASTGDIADADGLTGARYEYQWVRVDGTQESDIALANGPTYRLAAADLGKTVKVRVSFTDDVGSAESVTSEAFPDGGVLAAAVCKAPTYKDGQREIWKAELRGGGCRGRFLRLPGRTFCRKS